MADREKVIECLTDIEQIMIVRQDICPREELQYWVELQEGVADAIELLKEQETTSTGKTRIFQCKKCGYGIEDIYLSNEHDFDVYPKYCPNCGRAVKWND